MNIHILYANKQRINQEDNVKASFSHALRVALLCTASAIESRRVIAGSFTSLSFTTQRNATQRIAQRSAAHVETTLNAAHVRK